MGDVITFDGLETGSLSGTPDCGKLVPIHSPVIGQTIQVCEVDVKRLAGIGEMSVSRKPGRPRNTTVKNGAKRPSFKKCSKAKKTTTATGRVLCKCADPGNGQIQAGEMCNMPKRGK